MRLRTVFTYLCLLPLGACTRSCNEYDNATEFNNAQLPAYTETGANTLGCRLGTQVWTVLGAFEENGGIGNRWYPNSLYNSYRGGFLTLNGRMTGVLNSKEFYDTRIELYFQPLDTLGGLRLLGDTTFAVTGPGWKEFERIIVSNYLTTKFYVSDAHRPVRLVVRKHDRQQRIVSGTFEGYVYEQHGDKDSLNITDGRFDVHYE